MRVSIAVVACVCAVLSEGRTSPLASTSGVSWLDVPDYVGHLELLHNEGRNMIQRLPHGALEITDPRRHYVVIFGVLGAVVEYLNSDCSFQEYDKKFLPAVDRLLPVLWQYPDVAVDKLETFIFHVNETVQKIQDLKDVYCINTLPKVCNFVIEALTYIKKDYKHARNVLIAAGKLAAVYRNNPYENEAKSYDEVALLLKGREKFRPLVFDAAEVYNLLYGKACDLKR